MIPLLCIYPRKMATHVHTKACTEVCLGASFIRAYNYIIQMSINKRMDKQVIHTVDYYSGIGRSKPLKSISV